MQTKLQELTEKIYQEGVNKANDEAEKILSGARAEADKIIAEAKKNAQGLVQDAEKSAKELTNNSLNELQLSARQAISDIKQQVVALIQTQTVSPEVKAAMASEEFTLDIIREIVKNWNPKSSDTIYLEMVLPENRKNEFEKHFNAKAKDLLSSSLTVNFSNKLKAGFKIGPKDGGYLISFSDEDFDNFFKSYLRPKLIDLLYSK